VEDLRGSIDQRGRSPGADRWRKILKTIDSYARLVDTAIQHSPAITALVWAGVKTILLVSGDSMLTLGHLFHVVLTIDTARLL